MPEVDEDKMRMGGCEAKTTRKSAMEIALEVPDTVEPEIQVHDTDKATVEPKAAEIPTLENSPMPSNPVMLAVVPTKRGAAELGGVYKVTTSVVHGMAKPVNGAVAFTWPNA